MLHGLAGVLLVFQALLHLKKHPTRSGIFIRVRDGQELASPRGDQGGSFFRLPRPSGKAWLEQARSMYRIDAVRYCTGLVHASIAWLDYRYPSGSRYECFRVSDVSQEGRLLHPGSFRSRPGNFRCWSPAIDLVGTDVDFKACWRKKVDNAYLVD